MFGMENKMVVIIITLTLHCNIPDCVNKHLYKLQAPVAAPVVAPALCHTNQQRPAVQTQHVLYQSFIN